MARSSQYWMMVLAVLFVTTVAATTLVSADEAAPTFTEETTATISEKIEAGKEFTKKEAAQAGETVKSWKEWAMKQAGEWTGKGRVAAGEASESATGYATQSAEYLHSSSAKAHESATGFFNKWSTWAKQTAGKYKPEQNPAAQAVEYINKHTSSGQDEEL